MSSSAAPAERPASTLPKHIPYLYIVYGLLSGFGTTLALGQLVFFITEYTGVSPTMMATIYTIARIADLIVSMFAGPSVQRMRRVRPALLIIPLISGFGTLLSFLNPPIPLGPKYALLILGYCCIHFPMNWSTVVINRVLMAIAGPNPANRLAITSNQQRGTSSGSILISLITVPGIMFLQSRGLPGYLMIAALYVVIWLCASFLLYTISAPYEPKDAPAPLMAVQRVTIGQMYRAAMSNKLVLVLFFAITLAGIGAQVFAAGPMYYFRYSIGNLSWQAINGTIRGFVALFMAIVCPPLARRLGKRKSYIFQYIWIIFIYTTMMLFADGRVYVYIAAFSALTFGTQTALAWGANLWIDAAEIQLHETGVDNRPFITSINNFPIKLGFIFSGPVVAFMLNNSGYSVVDGRGTIANTQVFMYSWLGTTVGLYVLAIIIFFLGYKTDEKYAAECAAANAAAARERAAAAAAAAAPRP